MLFVRASFVLALSGLSLLSLFAIACAAGTGGGGDPTPGGGGGSGDASTSQSHFAKDGGASTKEEDPKAAGPVQIKNLSGTGGGTTTALSLTFVLKNTAAQDIERIKEVTVKAGSTSVAFMTTCQSLDWNVSAGATSDVLDVTVSGSTTSAISYGANCTAYGDEALGSSKDITLEIKGLLDDATPWTAEAETTL
jgi:hypothetical protein